MADGTMSNLLSNNLFLSLLSQGGASLAGEDSLAAGINPILQNTIAAQSKAKEQNRQMQILAKLLGQGVDFKSDANGKATVSGDLSTLLGEELAKQSGLGTITQPSNVNTSTGPTPTGTVPVAQPKSTQNGLLSSMLNFNSSPSDVPAYSDLVGLTPKDISDSLAGAINVESLKRQSINDINNRLYRNEELKLRRDNLALDKYKFTEELGLNRDKLRQIVKSSDTDNELKKIDLEYKKGRLSLDQLNSEVDRLYKKALINQANATAEKTRPSIIIPGTDIKLNSDQYVDWYKAANKDERTAAIKNYEYAQAKGYKGSFEQFQDISSTTHQKDYDRAKAEGYEGGFNKWMLEMTKAGAINLGDVVAKREATADVDTKKYFTDPKGLVTDVDNYVNTEEVQNKLFALDPKLREVETIRAKEKYITGKITGSGGEIVGQKLEGRTFVWTVKWPDGKITEVKYAN